MSDVPAQLNEQLYRIMRTIRAADERLRRALSTGEVALAYWPVTGHEAIGAGIGAALGPNDEVLITYRGLSNAIAVGVPLDALYGELIGRQVGFSHGKGGPMGLSLPEKKLMLSTGIVGAGPPIANGVAWARTTSTASTRRWPSTRARPSSRAGPPATEWSVRRSTAPIPGPCIPP
jgi:acetoin:2,6-dichlorophenolindophenol oxidoreductase subunit alpha